VTAGGLHYDRYIVNGHQEWSMRIGDPADPLLLCLPPLFEEMNRTRAFLASVMRRVAAAGYCCRLPDLPGTGESVRALEEVSWQDWQDAARAAADGTKAVVSVRGGCLLDSGLSPSCTWRLAPVEGASLVRDLERAGLVSEGGGAGYAPSEALLESVRAASPAGAARTARLASDRAEADLKVDGPSLWRRSEPQNSSELVEAIASDIVQWVVQCAAS
jgi:pimeloyl-ACP methyl ester carboxylesterase